MSTPITFTRANLAALPLPTNGRSYHMDTKTRGLAFAITQQGTRSFVFYRKIKGRPQRVLLGRFDELSIEQARNKAAALNALVADGWDPRTERERHRREPTLRELYLDFEDRYARSNVRSHEKYRALFERYFGSDKHGGGNLAERRVCEITRADYARVVGGITADGHPVVANRALAVVSSMLSWAVRAGLVETNPAKGIRKNGERSRARDRFLRPHEMPHFFQALAAHDSDVMRDYVLLSLLTGQRQANVLAMEWSEIDFHSNHWRIPKDKTKTAKEYLVPLTPDALEILQRRLTGASGSRFVLPGEGSTGHFSEPKGGWQKILIRAEGYALISVLADHERWQASAIGDARANLEFGPKPQVAQLRSRASGLQLDVSSIGFTDLWMHDLRRTLASWQASTGANLVAISKTLNHSNVSTTSIYARLQTDPVRQAIQVATDAMLASAGVRHPTTVVRIS